MGSNLSAAVGAMLKDTNFFLLIEDYGYSKSRTKIGVSVDIKVWEKTQKLCGINLILHRYLWEHQNIWELSTQKIEQNLGKVKTFSFFTFLIIIFSPYQDDLLLRIGYVMYWLGFLLSLITIKNYLKSK